jgi:protein involved in polysaccharide export with SLBB domain
VSPGKSLTIFPQGHRLLDSAKELRASAPDPLPLPRELDKRVLAAYVVEPGDALLVQPADLDSPVHFPADQPVLPDGTINLGRYGRVVVAGMTVDEIENAVRAAVSAQTKNPGPMTVRIVTRASKVYYVLGEVNAPGAFQLTGRETVLDGIIAAGGLTDRGSRRNIILSRPTPPDGCRIVLPICYREIVHLGDTSTNYQLAPGDRIFVATRTCCDELPWNAKKECPPCGRPQVPCAGTGGDCGHPFGPATLSPRPADPVLPTAPTPEPVTPAPRDDAPGLQPTSGTWKTAPR